MKTYDDYQSSRDREYLEAWKQLSPEQRKALADAGVDGPALPVYRTYKRDDEQFVERIAGNEDPVDRESVPETGGGVREEALAIVRSILGEIMAQPNARLALDCFAVVTGIGYNGESLTEIAQRHGVTRAAISKRCVELSTALDLPPSRAMRQLTARSAYEKRARHHHSRNGH